MTDTPNSAAEPHPDGFSQTAAEGASSLDLLKSKGAQAAADIDKAFEQAGLSLAKSLSKAASDGKVSLGELAAAAIQAIDVFARSSSAGTGGGGLADALGGVLKSVFEGARADGGPVGGGGSYLVGERGPELFRPSTAGDIGPLGGGGTVVNVTVQGGGAPSILRSEAQIAAALARAVRMGASGGAG